MLVRALALSGKIVTTLTFAVGEEVKFSHLVEVCEKPFIFAQLPAVTQSREAKWEIKCIANNSLLQLVGKQKSGKRKAIYSNECFE